MEKINKPIIEIKNISKYYKKHNDNMFPTFRDAFLSLFNFNKKNKNYSNFTALDNISLSINSGDIIGILGKNGAGKSTLLKCISKVTFPSNGKIKLRGRVGSLLEIGTGFHPELTGRENIYLNGTILGMKKKEIDKVFDQIVDFADISSFLDTQVKYYSSGMYMRLAFSVASHITSEVIIIDEVLAVGDMEFQKKCLGKMNSIAREGRTVLFVSHMLPAIEELCNRIIILDNGKLIADEKDVSVGVAKYINMLSKTKHISHWKNDKNEYNSIYYTPIEFWIGYNNGKKIEDNKIKNEDDIYVYIKGKIDKKHNAIRIGFGLYNEQNMLIYWSYCTDMSKENWPTLNEKEIIIRTNLPKNFLNEGVYRIDLAIELYAIEWICNPHSNPPSIYFEIENKYNNASYFVEKRSGICAPVLLWDNFYSK